MIKLDEGKLEAVKERHWHWFWIRAKRKKILLKKSNGCKWNLSYAAILLLYFGWSETDLKKIILASAKDIKKYTDKNSVFYKTFCQNYNKLKYDLMGFPPPQIQNTLIQKNEADKLLEKLFGYDDFIDGIIEPFENESSDVFLRLKEWNAYSFTESLGVDVCPYCNRQYVFTLKKGNGRPEIDHFYPKVEYPYLSCSLSNFIPSCHSCNHKKSDDYNTHILKKSSQKNNIFYARNFSHTIYPYRESFDTLGIKFCLSYRNKEKKKVYFFIDYPKKTYEWKKIKNTIEAFHLKEYYNSQQIEINDLLKRYQNYAEPKIKDILDTIIYPSLSDEIDDLKKNLSSLSSVDDYIQNFLEKVVESYINSTKKEILGIPMNNDDGKEYPFRKFKEDIIKQFDDEHQMINYWAWGGKYIGFREGGYLYSKKGNPIGYFDGDEIFDFNGKYLCDVIDGRLITKLGLHAAGNTMKKPNNMSRKPCSNYAGYAMRQGYQDFIWNE